MNVKHVAKSLLLKRYFTLLIILIFVFNTQAAVTFQKPEQKIDQLLQQADDLKYEDFDAGFAKLKEAQHLAQELKSDEKLGDVYTMFGIYYYRKGTYDHSLQMYLKAIQIHEKYHNEKSLARSLNGVALIQSAFNQLEESIITFEKSVVLDLKNNNYQGIARSYFNIGIAQTDLKQYDLAAKNLKKALTYSKKNNLNQVNHMVESRLGDIMLVKNKKDSAFYYYNLVFSNPKQLPNNWETTYVHASLANAYLTIGEYDNAEKNGIIAYETAKKLNANWDLSRAAKILAEIYEKKNNTAKAYSFLQINNAINDSLYSERRINDVNYLQLKSKEVENVKLKAKNELSAQKVKRDQIIIYSFLILILFLIGIIFLRRRNARLKDVFNEELRVKNADIENQKLLISQQNTELIALNDTKNKLFSIVSHDLRSPIANIVQMLELQKDDSLTPELQQDIFDQLHLQTVATSNMLNNLLQWANTQMDGQIVNFEVIDIYELSKSVLELYILEMNKKNITFSNELPSTALFISADKGQVRVIIQNIIANAVKFTDENGTISCSYSENGNFINVHIANSGASIEERRITEILKSDKRIYSELGTSFEEGTGLGLLLVKQFIANNKGTLDIKSGEEVGTEFIISFMKN
ncbi:ATP-binding protein [Flavobacterium antarcticum]